MKTFVPLEEDEHNVLADWLNIKGLFWIHVPNEGKRSWRTGAKMKRMGLRKGAPDFLIFDRPPGRLEVRGVAVEMKRAAGGRVSEDQEFFLRELERHGWIAMVCRGATEAIGRLERMGF